MIYRLVYMSKCAVAPISEAVEGIARKSLSYNAQVGITGFLYFDDSVFIQEIEGIQSDVEALYSKISADPRHTEVRTLLSQDAETRVFGQWSMAFYDGQAEENLVHRTFGPDFFSTLSAKDGTEILRVLRELSLSADLKDGRVSALTLDNA